MTTGAAVTTADLDQLADQLGAGWLIDAAIDGGVSVTPAADDHVQAAGRLARQLGALPDDLDVHIEGPRWAPIEGGPWYAPDITVLPAGVLNRRGYGLNTPPLLVVEVLSPSTRRGERSHKADAYYEGGAEVCWTVELPSPATPGVTLIDRRRGPDGWVQTTQTGGVVRFTTGDATVVVDLDRLA